MGAEARNRFDARRQLFEPAGTVVGCVHAVRSDGVLLVDHPGNPLGPLVARTALASSEAVAAGATVLLVFDGGDPAKPIVAGLVRDAMPVGKPAVQVERKRGSSDEVFVDGAALAISAEHEIIIRCGASSLTLTRDGRIVLKGKEIISRASGVNKIKGAAVNIN